MLKLNIYIYEKLGIVYSRTIYDMDILVGLIKKHA